MCFPSKIVFLLTFVFFQSTLTAQFQLAKETNLTNNSAEDRYASYSPDGNKILFESNRDGDWAIYVMDSDGSNVKKLSTGKSNNRRPSWHPSGEKVLFESDRNGKFELFVLDIESLEISQITSFPMEEPRFADFSPNGKTIAISLKESDDKSNIVIIDMSGKIIKKLTDTPYRSYYPRWSPNGEEIVYFSRKATENQDDEIYRINIETGEDRRLTHWPKHNFCPAWSNDGGHFVYVTSMENTRPEIYIMNSDGSNQTRITYNEDGDTLPDWSPNGNKLLITGYRNGNFEICELELGFGRK